MTFSRSPTPRHPYQPIAARSPVLRPSLITRPTLPAVFRKLDAAAVLAARLLPAPQPDLVAG